MSRYVFVFLGFTAGVFAVFAILACGGAAVWCFACAIIGLITGLIIGGDV